ncbi:hypothetical protein G5V59_11240 [Nocardioides sp. W3-2-3]|uniref:hypothetical protein n=1 Tax=Nocardioides convexus TaxID=2712224 RepID=UPI002418482C|nr:hypothetical protein [Nocardioides convexus]NHA00441.1 hypothetical protein [Nocardioides convexus]
MTSTGGTFAVLGADGSAGKVVDAIGALEAKRIERPPVVQVYDRPHLGTLLAGVGLGGLGVIWLLQALLALRARQEAGR